MTSLTKKVSKYLHFLRYTKYKISLGLLELDRTDQFPLALRAASSNCHRICSAKHDLNSSGFWEVAPSVTRVSNWEADSSLITNFLALHSTTMSRGQALCQQCSEITLTLPVSKTLLREYPDIRSLHGTADEGCAFCILIHASHQAYHNALSKQRIRPWIENESRHSKISVYHWIYDSILRVIFDGNFPTATQSSAIAMRVSVTARAPWGGFSGGYPTQLGKQSLGYPPQPQR